MVLEFAFGTIRIRRLEARVSVHNGRGNGALRKLGATSEGLLRRSFVLRGHYQDQVLWSILDSDCLTANRPPGTSHLATSKLSAE
jgi:ribosomal-protein-alanine N-acetyltransferase